MNEISIHLLLGIILVITEIFRIIAVKLNQPLVIGEIFSGLIIGCILSMLYLITDNSVIENNLIFSLSNLGELGLAFIVLNSLFHQQNYKNNNFKQVLIITVCNIIPSFFAGIVFSIIYLHYNTNLTPIAFILLTATSVSVSAVPVLSKILTELKLENSILGTVLFQSSCWTDLLAWIMVGIILSLNTGNISLYFVFERFSIIIILIIILKFLAKNFNKYFSTSSSVSKIILLILFFSTGITHFFSLHLVFGAFLVGIIFRSNMHVTKNWIQDSLWINEKLFSPIFFTVAGINATTNQNISLTHIGWGLIFLIISITSKIIPLYFGARKSGFSKKDSQLIGVLLNTRGLMEIAILSVGLKAKIYEIEQFTIFIIVALITTIICTPLCKYILNNNKEQEVVNNVRPLYIISKRDVL